MKPPLTATDPTDYRAEDVPEGRSRRKVRMSETLFQQLGADRVTWGEPDADGFYSPTLYKAEAATPEAAALPNVLAVLDEAILQAVNLGALIRTDPAIKGTPMALEVKLREVRAVLAQSQGSGPE